MCNRNNLIAFDSAKEGHESPQPLDKPLLDCKEKHAMLDGCSASLN